jgi:hypothetical protein
MSAGRASATASGRAPEPGLAGRLAVAATGLVDLAMIFGTGFPPWRGEPLRHADSVGLVGSEQCPACGANRERRFVLWRGGDQKGRMPGNVMVTGEGMGRRSTSAGPGSPATGGSAP